MLKKLNLSIILLFILSDLSSFSLSNLINSTLQNNSDIASAQSNYESAILSSKTLDGTFAPEISFSSSANLSKDYDWNTSPDYFSTYVTYSQPLPGGTTISATGTYSFTSTTTFSATTATTTDAGNLAALRELKISGSTNQAKITELESTKWSYQEDLMSVQASFYSYLQNLKNICACEIAENDLFNDDFTDFPPSEEIFTAISDISANPKTSDITDPATSTNNSIPADPMKKIYQLKLQMLKNNRILENQKSAPTLTISLLPAWPFEKTKADDWKSAWI